MLQASLIDQYDGAAFGYVQVLVYGDCAVNVEPKAEELALIAVTSAETAAAFGVTPRVAMLSYSTGVSGAGPQVTPLHAALVSVTISGCQANRCSEEISNVVYG